MSEIETNQEDVSPESGVAVVEGDVSVNAFGVDSLRNEEEENNSSETHEKYMLPEKFKDKSVDDIAKSYEELEKKFSTSRPDAPESYELQLSEELQEAGVNFNEDDPLINSFTEIAKNSRLSQEDFSKIINLHAESVQDMFKMSEEDIAEYRKSEIEKLGENGPAIVETLKTWGKNNLNEDEYNLFMEFGDSHDRINFLQKLINKGTEINIVGSGGALTGGTQDRNYYREIMASDKYLKNSQFAAKIDKEYADAYNSNKNFA